MELWIDNRSGVPIYDQITCQLREKILSGELTEDTMLPSIRSLAKDLHISVITTKRAYEELEREGLIYTVAGKGCYVGSRNPEMVREADLRQMEEHLLAVRKLAETLDMDAAAVMALYKELSELAETNEGEEHIYLWKTPLRSRDCGKHTEILRWIFRR